MSIFDGIKVYDIIEVYQKDKKFYYLVNRKTKVVHSKWIYEAEAYNTMRTLNRFVAARIPPIK